MLAQAWVAPGSSGGVVRLERPHEHKQGGRLLQLAEACTHGWRHGPAELAGPGPPDRAGRTLSEAALPAQDKADTVVHETARPAVQHSTRGTCRPGRLASCQAATQPPTKQARPGPLSTYPQARCAGGPGRRAGPATRLTAARCGPRRGAPPTPAGRAPQAGRPQTGPALAGPAGGHAQGRWLGCTAGIHSCGLTGSAPRLAKQMQGRCLERAACDAVQARGGPLLPARGPSPAATARAPLAAAGPAPPP